MQAGAAGRSRAASQSTALTGNPPRAQPPDARRPTRDHRPHRPHRRQRISTLPRPVPLPPVAVAVATAMLQPPARAAAGRVLEGGAVRYSRGRRASVSGDTLATYSWELAGARAPPRARILLVHGFRSHARYNFMASSARGLHCYGGEGDERFVEEGGGGSSFVRELGLAGFDVHAHDHVGHGDSGGLRTYFPSFDCLVEDVVAHARDLRAGRGSHEEGWGREEASGGGGGELPVYVVAHSMGGAVAVLASMQAAGLFDGLCLSSAASEAPAHVSGWWGAVLTVGASLASVLLPRTELYPLEKNTRLPEMQALFESDPMNSLVAVRGRVGHEFLRAYRRIAANLGQVVVPFITMSGGVDTLVNPEASRRFYKGTASKDKELNVREEFWHNLLTEPGKEENWRLYIEWLDLRAPRSK